MDPFPPSGPDGLGSTDTRDTTHPLLRDMQPVDDLHDEARIELTDLGQAVLAALRATS